MSLLLCHHREIGRLLSYNVDKKDDTFITPFCRQLQFVQTVEQFAYVHGNVAECVILPNNTNLLFLPLTLLIITGSRKIYQHLYFFLTLIKLFVG